MLLGSSCSPAGGTFTLTRVFLRRPSADLAPRRARLASRSGGRHTLGTAADAVLGPQKRLGRLGEAGKPSAGGDVTMSLFSRFLGRNQVKDLVGPSWPSATSKIR